MSDAEHPQAGRGERVHQAPRELRGIGVSPGRVAGPVARIGAAPELPDQRPDVSDVEAEVAAALAALEAVATELERRAAVTTVAGAADVLGATAMIARDPALAQAVRAAVAAGAPAAWALDEATGSFRELLSSLGGHLAERAADLGDVRDRAVAHVLGAPMPGVPERDTPFVLLADDLSPADTATLSPDRVLALVTARGGPTSHTAILARALGLPAVVACEGASTIRDGDMVVVDGATGDVRPATDEAEVEQVNVEERSRRQARASSRGPGRTSDGHRVSLLVNIGDAAGAAAVADVDAEGVGLFRTEFLFLDRHDAPGVEEQVEAYREVFAALGGRRVVVRTLDAGADKPLPFLAQDEEENPALGVRGLRTARRRPEVLEDQLTALARAATGSEAEVWVMAPMVATVAEAAWFTAAAREHGLAVAGAMVEVPAAALRAADLLRHCDFLSIGTNDLSQYTLAADRMSGELAELLDPSQPALLELVRLTASAGREAGRPVGVCGEAAASPVLAPVLVGLGVTSLSMSAGAVADVREALAQHTLEDCERLAREALAPQA